MATKSYSDGWFPVQRFCDQYRHQEIKAFSSNYSHPKSKSTTSERVVTFFYNLIPPYNDMKRVEIDNETMYILCGPAYGLMQEFARWSNSALKFNAPPDGDDPDQVAFFFTDLLMGGILDLIPVILPYA